jgi:hypothetical protein
MKMAKKMILGFLVLAILALAPAAYADVVVRETTTTTSGFGHPDTPIGDFFYLLGDVIEFPFNLLGNLF